MPRHLKSRADEKKIECMAAFMQDRQAANGSCTEDDLRSEGFTSEEIGVYAEVAAQQAQAAFVRHI